MAPSDDEEEDEREPTLKYAKLTSHLGSLYRGGDSSSAFAVSGDKLHVFAIPSLNVLRSYRAHTGSITSIAVSPYQQSLSIDVKEPESRAVSGLRNAETPTGSSKTPRNLPPATPSNAIHIGTASIDGKVCISALVDEKDITLRNFARPVHAIALSPSFKTDRQYLSGGTAGELILTTGGKLGSSSDANTNGTPTAGWLSTVGLGSSSGKDVVLHSGEGAVSAINWSTSGRFVAWNNEYGTRIMHSNLYNVDSDIAWKRLGHVPRPKTKDWEELSGVWRAHSRWVDSKFLESNNDMATLPHAAKGPQNGSSKGKGLVERLLVGWGDTVWMIHVTSQKPTPERPAPPAKAEIVHRLTFEDSILSGLALYTPDKLLVLVYRTVDDNDDPVQLAENGKVRKGRHNGLPPDLRLIDLASPEYDELETESVVVGRYERLSFADYHLSSLFVTPQVAQQATRSTLGAIGGGFRDMGVNATRLFSSGASVLSASSEEKNSISTGLSPLQRRPTPNVLKQIESLTSPGLKILIQSPFDLLVAIKRNLQDHLQWTLDHEEYELAWNLVKEHPSVVNARVKSESSRPSSPSHDGQSLQDFLDDSESTISTIGGNKEARLAVEREQERIGDLWIRKLVDSGDWAGAATVAGKTLGNSHKWADWIDTFANSGKFDEITPVIPGHDLRCPIPPRCYEIILAYYVAHGKPQFQDLLNRWSISLFDASTIIQLLEDELRRGRVSANTVEDGEKGRDWTILQECLAKLYLAEARPTDAVHCYLRTKNADAVLEVVREYTKMEAIADRVYEFVTVRIPSERTSLAELDTLSEDAIELLATASVQGTVEQKSVVSQLKLKTPASRPFSFFYFRRLWTSDNDVQRSGGSRSRFAAMDAAESPSRLLLAPFADEVVSSFAEYSQPLLADYLKTSKDYSFELASDLCRQRHYIPELVYLLSATGQTKNALHLIIDELGDVPMAIAFVKDNDDEALWDDLLDYSMDKPKFIGGLLDDLGTTIDPVKLVKRIPLGLEIDGLKSSLGSLLRESEITWSISNGASQVLSAEISAVLSQLRSCREKGVAFRGRPSNIVPGEFPTTSGGICESCAVDYSTSDDESTNANDLLIGFLCGHVFHLSCLLDELLLVKERAAVEKLRRDLAQIELSSGGYTRQSVASVGGKIKAAQMIKAALGGSLCYKCHPAQ